MKTFCGIDKIHYSILKSQSAWSHIAKKLISSIGTNASPKLKNSEVAFSIANNIARILLIDMLSMANKSNGTF